VVLIVEYLRKHGTLTKISEGVHFARRRFGHYEVIDFLAVLFGYAISGERTLEAFYDRLQPFAVPFMALFDRDRLPARSTLSRFLAALTEAPVEALRTLLTSRSAQSAPHARPRKLEACWIEPVTPGSCSTLMGREKRLANAPYPRLMTFLHPVAGWATYALLETLAASVERWSGRAQRCYRRTATSGSAVSGTEATGAIGKNYGIRLSAIGRYLTTHHLPQERARLGLDGQYGNGAVLSDVASFAFVTRGKDYHLLDHPLIQARLHLPPDQFQQRTDQSDGA
jgi:hypothetical protein